MNVKQPECWSIDPQARGLRVEISPSHSIILPWEHFAFAELTSAEAEEILTLSFSTHQFVIHGRLLRRIEAAIQRMELSCLSMVPDKFRSLVGENQSFISSIEMTAVDSENGDESTIAEEK
jgi:hypothetical protein